MRRIMRTLWGIIALSLMLMPGLAISADADPAAKAVPQAVFQEDSFRFQKVAEGQEVTHTFAVQNSGQATLVIERIKTG